MKFFYKILCTICITFPFSSRAQNAFFTDKSASTFKYANQQVRPIIPDKFRAVSLDVNALKQFFSKVPLEFTTAAQNNQSILSIPMPDGTISHFSIVESPIQEAGLMAKFPGIKTYSGQGIDDRTATIKLDWTELGFHAQILSPITGSIYIDPYERGNVNNYISYFKQDLKPTNTYQEIGVEGIVDASLQSARTTAGFCFGSQLRTYRLAVACTGEYAVAVGGTNASLLHSAIVTTVNRVNGVYEKEVAIRLVLIANNNIIEYLNAASDPFTGNDDANTLINESQSVITSNIGSANFDIGHTFSTGAGGLAGLGVVCINGQKARGVTGSTSPTGDAYDIDFVAHEIGHQFGGNHTFNALTGNCSGNRNPSTAVEPGSGVTIMGYAGICNAANNLASNSIPFFHATSQIEIGNYSNNSNGNTCAAITNTGNSAPVVNAGSDFSIPAGTPFVLTGSATDVNGDALTYSWEQIDAGSVGANWNSGSKPFFRSFAPRVSPIRHFPQLSDVANATQTIGEFLPTTTETINFRLTVRDNKNLGGGVCSDEMIVNTVAGTPFTVTSQNTSATWTGNGTNTATITWNVANTTAAPFNTANVAIFFSADGGLTFPYTLLASTANDGSETITIPSVNTIKGRVMVRAIGNVFFNLNAANITVTASSCAAEGATITPTSNVSATVGSGSLNLSLSPQYATAFAASGTITLTDASTGLIGAASSGGPCTQFSNIYHYDVYPFVVSVTGSYTFTRTGAGSVYNFFANSFNPASGCTNWIASNFANGVGTSAAVTINLTAGTPYFLVQGVYGADATTPNTGIPFNYSFAITTTPSGGAVYNGSGLYTNPGASFSYGYVMVNNATNNIVAISATANLSNSGTYPAGVYSVYGLSYLTANAAAIQTFVGGSLTAMTNALATQPNTYCANFSKNSVTVTVNAIVPVTLTGLKARKQNTTTQLEWSTLSESNASHFEIQRSADGVNFNTTIGKVLATGNSNITKNYGLTDVSPLKGWSYYRAKMVDLDGKFAYSNIAALNFDKTVSPVLVYPNPAVNTLNVEFTTLKAGKINMQIIDAKGTIVVQQNNTVVAGRTTKTLQIATLPKAVYVLKYTDVDDSIHYIKFIKE